MDNAENGIFTNTVETLGKLVPGTERIYGFEQVRHGWRTEDPALLKIKSPGGDTIAHAQAVNGWNTDNLEILKLKNKDGVSVAHEQVAWSSWRTNDPEVLKIADRDGMTVAHRQAQKGWKTQNRGILKLKDDLGRAVAHIQTYRGWTTDDPEILRLARNDGVTVAHKQAEHGWTTENPEILKMADEYGETVAHTQAQKGWTTTNREILRLCNHRECSVGGYVSTINGIRKNILVKWVATLIGKSYVENTMPNGKVIESVDWRPEDLKSIQQHVKEDADINGPANIKGDGPSWVLATIAAAMPKDFHHRLATPDGTVSLTCGSCKEGGEGPNIIFDVRKNGNWNLVTVKAKDASVPIKTEDIGNVHPPKIAKGENVVISGQIPNWMVAALSAKYSGRNQVAVHQQGFGAMFVNGPEIGKVVAEKEFIAAPAQKVETERGFER